MHHVPAGPPFSARVSAALSRWGLRLRAVLAVLAALASFVHRSRVLPVTLASLVIGGLAVVLPVVSSAEPRQPDGVALSSTDGGVGDLMKPVPGGDWTTDGGSDATPSRSARESEATEPGAGTSARTPSGEDAGEAEGTTPAPTPGSPSTGSTGTSTAPGSAAPSSSSSPSSSSPGSSSPSSSSPSSSSPSSSSPSSSSPLSQSSAPAPSSAAPAADGTKAQVLALVNAERSAAGCAPVTADAGLAAVAREHSLDMRDRDFFDHVNPDGLDAFDRAEQAGVTNARAENIARGQADAAAVMASWMDSPVHRANILDCGLRTMGVGVATGAGGPWWTQLFGS